MIVDFGFEWELVDIGVVFPMLARWRLRFLEVVEMWAVLFGLVGFCSSPGFDLVIFFRDFDVWCIAWISASSSYSVMFWGARWFL